MAVSTHWALGLSSPCWPSVGFSLAGASSELHRGAAATALDGDKPTGSVTPARQGIKRFIEAITLIMQISPCLKNFKTLEIHSGMFFKE